MRVMSIKSSCLYNKFQFTLNFYPGIQFLIPENFKMKIKIPLSARKLLKT